MADIWTFWPLLDISVRHSTKQHVVLLQHFLWILKLLRDCRLQLRSRRETEYYAACSGNFLPTFRENLSVLSSRELWDRQVAPKCW